MRLIGFDFETHPIRPGCLAPRAVCISLAGRGEPPKYLPRDEESWWRSVDDGWEVVYSARHTRYVFANLSADPDVVMVAHNLSFDLGVLIKKEPQFIADIFAMMEKGRLRDTMLREKLINVAHGDLDFHHETKQKMKYSLADLVKKYFKVDISATKTGDSWRLRYNELDFVPLREWPEAALVYSAQDSTWARRVFEAQNQTPAGVRVGTTIQPLHREGLVVNELEQTAAALALHLMACRGVVTDPVAVGNFRIQVMDQVEEARGIAMDLGFMRLDGSRNMKILKGLVAEAYGDHPPLTAKGAIKTDRKTLQKSGNPQLKEYARNLNAEKLLNTYLPILEQGTRNPICSKPNVLVRSGRTSWKYPNLQNPPRKSGFRECFIPQPGNIFCTVDYSSIELRAFAQVQLDWYGNSRLAEAFQRGVDPHLQFGASLIGMELELAKEALKDDTHPEHKEVKEARQFAKIANFGFPGGLAAETFVEYCNNYGKHIDITRARELRKAWLDEWEETRQYFEDVSRMTKLDGTIVQLRSGRIRGDVSYTSACNSFFQGLTADGIKYAMWELCKRCYTSSAPFEGVYPWVLIHDEIIAEGPEDTAHKWAPAMAELMVKTMQEYIPDVPIEAEPALMRRWYKDAAPVYDDSGKLLVWESPDERRKSSFPSSNSH
jgi:DNA polymerase I-like protein with 3'-5' exonuclease and polymerase domains